MAALVGQQNMREIASLQNLTEDRFALDGIEEQAPRLITFPDTEKLDGKANIDRLLSLTGRDGVQIPRKNRRSARYTHEGGVVINSTDFLFSTKHRRRGMTRRSVLVQSWRVDSALSGIESEFTADVISAYTNFLLSLPEDFILETLRNAPGEPSLEIEGYDNPLLAWLLDCVEITGDSADRLQLGRDRGVISQLFGNYIDYCLRANLGERFAKTHTSFAKDFDLAYERLAATLKDDTSRQFGRVKPGNKLHYIGLRLKLEADDTSRIATLSPLQILDKMVPHASPIQQAINDLLGSNEAAPAEPDPIPELDAAAISTTVEPIVEQPSADIPIAMTPEAARNLIKGDRVQILAPHHWAGAVGIVAANYKGDQAIRFDGELKFGNVSWDCLAMIQPELSEVLA
jgi:hypothetical protein